MSGLRRGGARLFCRTGRMAGDEHFFEERLTIGRDSGNTIVLPLKFVSGTQARLEYSEEEGGYVLHDLGSRNGTRLDGRLISRPRRLGDLHVITFPGDIDYIFQRLTKEVEVGEKTDIRKLPVVVPTPALFSGEGLPVEERADPDTVMHAVPATPSLTDMEAQEEAWRPTAEEVEEAEKTVQGRIPVLPSSIPSQEETEYGQDETSLGSDGKAEAGGTPATAPPPRGQPTPAEIPESVPPAAQLAPEASPYLLMTRQEGGTARSFALLTGENLIGRAEECRIRLDDSTVSRQQAALIVGKARVILRNLTSLNRTIVDGKPLQGEMEIKPGQSMRFGKVQAALVVRKRPQPGS